MGYTLNKDTKTLKPKGFKKMNFPKTHQKNAGVVILTSSNIDSKKQYWRRRDLFYETKVRLPGVIILHHHAPNNTPSTV